MEHFGMWGIIPPVLTIALAFITKDVIVSLFLGIVSGCLIVAGGNPAAALMSLSDLLAGSLANDWNIPGRLHGLPGRPGRGGRRARR